MRLRPIVGQPGSSSIISRVKLGQTTIQLRKRARFDDVGHRLGLTTGAQIMQRDELTLKALALGIAPLNEAQRRCTTVEVVSDWHWL